MFGLLCQLCDFFV